MHKRRPIHALLASTLLLIALGATASLAVADDHDNGAARENGTPPAEENGDSGTPATPLNDEGFPEAGPNFEEAECAFPVEDGDTSVDCGYLTVPADRDAPDEESIRLHVALFHSLAEETTGGPVVVLSGGPGESLLEQLTTGTTPSLPFLATNDVIVIEQRGVGFSEPAPDCIELQEVNQEAIEGNPSDEELVDASMAAISDCKDRLADEGVDTSIFSSTESAADLEALREALGYDEWNLYGISYGTRLALTTMRDFPEGIRSVVLDAPYPVEVNLFTESPASADRAFSKLFDACAGSEGCSEAYPDLEGTFHDVVERLDDDPVTLNIVDPTTGEAFEAPLDGTDFTSFVFQSLYSTGLIPLLPAIITEADEGEFGTVAAILGRIVGAEEFINIPMYLSVQCREDVGFTTDEEIASATDDYPYLEPLFGSSPQLGTPIVEVCAIWDAGMADESWKEAVTSDIPTLIFSGEFDPITPPSWAEQTNDNLPNSNLFTFPNVGHGSLFAEPCATELMLMFLEDPSAEPDSPCVDEVSGPAFQEPLGEITMVPFTNEELGFSGVVPEGWNEIAPGVWTRSEAALIVLSQQAIPGITADEALSNISTLLGLDAPPEPTGTCCGGEIEWELYEIDAAGTPANLAIAEVEGTTYLISLEGIAAAWEQLRKEVFLPAVEAFAPMEPGEEPPVGDINMVPFTAEDQGFMGVAPEGWVELYAGGYSPSEESSIVLSQESFPGVTPEEWLSDLQPAFPETTIEQTGTCCGGKLEWDIRELTLEGLNIAFALTESEGTTYLVSIEGPSNDDWARLYDEVFLPAVEAFMPLDGTPGEGETPGEGTPPGEFEVFIWWPNDGTAVSGIAPIHAALEGHDIHEYDMFWRADGDELVRMWNKTNHQTPHKKAYIDYHQWDWSENDDLYDIEVIAFAKDGRELGHTMVSIRHPSD